MESNTQYKPGGAAQKLADIYEQQRIAAQAQNGADVDTWSIDESHPGLLCD